MTGSLLIIFLFDMIRINICMHVIFIYSLNIKGYVIEICKLNSVLIIVILV